MTDEKKNVDDKDLKDVSGGVEYAQRQRAGNLTGHRSDDDGPDAGNMD